MLLKTIEITAENILSFAPYLDDEHIKAIVQKDTGAMGLLTEDMRSCGALFYRMNENEGSMFVESIYVDAGMRRNGGGRLLLNTLCEEKKYEYPDVVVRVLPGHADTMNPFLKAMGFDDIVYGEWVFETETIDIEEWMKSPAGKKCCAYAKEYESGIVTFDQAQSEEVRESTGADLDADISFMIEEKGKKSCILAAHAGEHDVLINGIYIADQRDDIGGALLYKALKTYADIQRDLGATLFYTLSGDTKDMWQSFFPKAPMSRISYARKDITEGGERIVISSYAFTRPRLNTIAKMLDDAGIAAWVDYDQEEGDAICLDREDGKRRISITSQVQDDRGESFITTIRSSFLLDDLDGSERKKLDAWVENPGLADVKVMKEAQAVICEVNLTEGMLPMEEEVFISILQTFIEELDRMEASDKPAPVSLKTSLLDDAE